MGQSEGSGPTGKRAHESVACTGIAQVPMNPHPLSRSGCASDDERDWAEVTSDEELGPSHGIATWF